MRILVIEDDQKIANAVKKGLEQESYAVDLSYDGKDGLSNALTFDYDLIILDRMLPETDGVKICQMLRDKKNTTPILMLTAKDTINDRVEGLNAGSDDYLIKPFAFEELVARVKALLRRPNKSMQDIIKVNDLSINTSTLEVKRDDIPVILSVKEYALLEYLARNAGQILSKDKIINHVWNFDADVLPNTVEVYIGYLRNKIDKPFKKKKPIIKTVRGFGYKVEKDKDEKPSPKKI